MTEAPVHGRRDAAVAAVSGVLFALVFYRATILSGFDRVFGDEGDARLAMMLMEHWHLVFSGRAAFFSPGFFYPERGAIGFTDANFLYGVVFTAGRWAGLGVYGAFQLVVIAWGIFAYTGMVWLLRRVLHCHLAVAVLAGDLFAFSNLNAVQVGHMQLLMAAFIPLLVGWVILFARRIQAGQGAAGPGYATAILYPLMMFTGFYVCWFLALFAVTVAIVALLAQAGSGRLSNTARSALHHWRLLAGMAAAACLAAIPFVIAYGRQFITGARFPVDALFLSTFPHLSDLINVGSANRVWGGLIARLIPDLNTRPGAYELLMGMAPGFFALFSASTVIAVWRGRKGLAAILAISVWIGLMMIVDVDGHSVWWLVRRAVPGATAIRVVSRYQVVLYPFAIIATALVASDGLGRAGRRFRPVLPVAFAMLGGFLWLEQVQPAFARIIKSNDLARLNAIPAPPAGCRFFMLQPPVFREGATAAERSDPGLVRQMQVDAIYESMRYGLPTVNGLSSLNPPQYWFFDLTGRYYSYQAGMWLARFHLFGGACALDLQNGAWGEIDPKVRPPPLGVNLLDPSPFLSDFQTGMSFAATGLEGGIGDLWTGRMSGFSFPARPAHLSVTLVFSVVNPSGSDVSVAVNGNTVRQGHFAPGSYRISERSEAPLDSLAIGSTVFRPADTGLSPDVRRLGVYLTQLSFSEE